jgi:uncharacterized protein YbbC (DUF1343 family)
MMRNKCRPPVAGTFQVPSAPIWLLVCAACLAFFMGSAAISQEWVSVTDGLGADTKQRIASMVQTAIEEKKMPGCVICVGRNDRILFLQSYGNKSLDPKPTPMSIDTVFDMASITKPVATGSSIMKLVEQGKLRLTEKVSDWFPEFANNEKQNMTVLDCLVHRSGLIPDNALADYQEGPVVAWDKICKLPLTAPIGTAFKYSDVNFIILGKIVEKVSGQPLDEFAQQAIFAPAGMSESGYRPIEALRARAAPTEKREGKWIQGEVHDPRAHLLNGVAGHAGLFSTARDMSLYARMFLNGGVAKRPDGTETRVLESSTLRLMAGGVPVPGGVRGLSWDKRTGFSINKGDLLSDAAVGHGGFTGTVLWIDPTQNLFFCFLSNRVHPDGKGLVNPLAGKLLNVIVSDLSAQSSWNEPRRTVLTGLDVLQRENFQQLAGKKVGLITNHTGRNGQGIGIVPLFAEAKNFELVALFSPEHGFEGKLDIEKVGDSQDSKTGLKVHSLYGETRKPTEEMLSSVDTVVFDIQDIGTRFYTYVSTMGEAMKAAAQYKKSFVVLDRPNPINGMDVSGPMLDAGSESFVAFHRMPVRHGMTVGELAKLFREELKLDLDLTVIACEGWKRSDFWDATGLIWVNPSPNMRSPKQALIYPGIGLLETTNISVGRGTDTPFEWIGAPWIKHRELADWLNEQGLPGVVFVPVEFTPTTSKYEKQLCRGIQFDVTDRKDFDSVRTGLVVGVGLRTLHGGEWETKSLNRLLGSKAMTDAILAKKSWLDLQSIATDGLFEFRKLRDKHLLYP